MVASMIERMCHFGGGGVWNFKPGQFDMSIHHAITQLVLAQKEPDAVSFYAKLRVNFYSSHFNLNPKPKAWDIP